MKFHCPHCNQRIEADESCAGKAVDCPACSEAFTVPFPEKSTPPPLSKKAGVAPPASESQLRRVGGLLLGIRKMNIFKKFFAPSPPPSHMSQVFVKWYENATEYGPYNLGELQSKQSKSWSGPPKIAKLSGDRKWRPYSEVYALLDQIEPSEDQKTNLEKLNVSAEVTSYSHAQRLIEAAKRKKKGAEQKKRRDEQKLPATKATLKKLREKGIRHSETITRLEAKTLLMAEEERERKDELLVQIKERGIELPSRVTLEELEELEGAVPPSEESLNELKKLCKTLDSWKIKYELPKVYTQDTVDDAIDTLPSEESLYELKKLRETLDSWNVKYKLPKIYTPDSVDDAINTFDEAISEAEGAVDEIRQGFLELDSGDYGLEGVAKNADCTGLMADIAKRVLKENWEFGKNLRSVVRKHFPDAKFEKIN